jgi:HlyD family secretion protein
MASAGDIGGYAMNKPETHWVKQGAELRDPEPEYHDVGAGTQGAALILELRRLQSALEHNLHERPPAPRPPSASPRRAAPTAPIEYRARARRNVRRTDGFLATGARRLVAFSRFMFARAPTDATAGALAPAPRPPSASPRRAAPASQIEYHAPERRNVRRTDGFLAIGARWLVAFSRFMFARARPGAQGADAAAGALGIRMDRALAIELRTGLRVLIAAVVIAGGWGTFVPLGGAIVAPGVIVVESKIKKVQHPTGGIVSQINVKDGSHVAAGDLLVRLDETQARANNQMLVKQLEQVQMRIARLVAERDGAADITLPHHLADREMEEDINGLIISERGQFTARSVTRTSQKELMRSNSDQLREQIGGLEAQAKSKAEQIELIAKELTGVQDLYNKGLSTITRLAGLQREASRLDGERGQIIASIAEAKSKISQTDLQLLRIDQDFRAEVTKELREAQDKEAELIERTTAANDQLKRIEVRAPVAGIVHELAVNTIGGVIAPGETMMEIVPETDDLVIEAHLPPQDIDQVQTGQTTHVRFPAFNQRTTPQLVGLVSYVSADLTRDKQSTATYYTVKVTLTASERRRLGDQQLVAGMPAEVFLQTTSRTMLSYLFKPITDQLARMFNER